jgi:hypothetical protein
MHVFAIKMHLFGMIVTRAKVIVLWFGLRLACFAFNVGKAIGDSRKK